MKILLINLGCEYGGVEKIVEEAILGLIKEKYQVNIACIENTEFHKSLIKLNRENDFTIIPIINKKKRVFKILNILMKNVKELNIDIIHSHGVTANLFGSIIATIKKIPNVTTIHSRADFDKNGGFKGKLFSFVEKKLFKYNKKYIVVSNNLFQYFKNINIDTSNIIVQHNGISYDREIEFINNQNKNSDCFHICSIGRLTKVKGFDQLIEALNILINKKKINLTCDIIGDGEEFENLNKMIKDYKLENNIKLLGFKDNVKEYMKNSDCLVMSSLMEGIPIVLLEAISLKLPVIAPNVGGIPEVIMHNRNGVLYEAGNVDKLYESIIWAYNNKIELEILTQNGYEDFLQYWSIDAYMKKLCEIYDSVIQIQY